MRESRSDLRPHDLGYESDRAPTGWAYIADLAEVNPRTPAPSDGEMVSFVAMTDVSESGVIQNVELREASTGYTPFAVGDVLVAKITPCFENGKGAHVGGLPTRFGQGSTEFHVLRPRSTTSDRYLYHLTRTSRFRLRGEGLMSGSAGQRRVPTEFFGRYAVRMPPLEEQRRIAEILDTIDETIRATERVIAKLDTISSALDEASLSGLRVEALRRLGDECRVLGGKRLPSGHSYSRAKTRYRYLRVVDFYKRSVDYDSLAALSKSTFEALSRYEIRSGELFISIAGSIGHVGVNRPPAGMRTILTENAARIVPSGSLVPGFLALQMNSPAVKEQVGAEIGTGGGVPKLALHRVANLRVSCPDISIQKEVAQWHEVGRAARDAETRKLDKLRRLRIGIAADLLSGRVRTVVA